MSAFMVSEAHIDVIVITAFFGPAEAQNNCNQTWYAPNVKELGFKLDDFSKAVRLGQLLTDENVNGLRSRYPSNNHDVNPYTLANLSESKQRFPALAMIKLIQCYQYQAGQHDGWDNSPASKFCVEMIDRLVHYMPGYESLPWSIGDFSELKAA